MIPLLEDILLEYDVSHSLRHIVALGMDFDLSFWEYTLSQNNIKLMGVNVNAESSSFDVEKAKSNPSSLFTVANMDEITMAEQIIVNRLCDEPEINPDDVKLITPVTMPNPLAPIIEKCETALEIQIVYGEKFNTIEIELFAQQLMHYFDGTIHVSLTIDNVISRMQEFDNYVLPVTTSNQYIIICLGLNNAQQQAIEQFNFVGDKEGYYFKVYSDHLDHVSIVDEMCEHQKPIDDIIMPAVFTPQKLDTISADTSIDKKPLENFY